VTPRAPEFDLYDVTVVSSTGATALAEDALRKPLPANSINPNLVWPLISRPLGAAPEPLALEGPDSDGDGLPDAFEKALADAATPAYFISRAEPNRFSVFADDPNQRIEIDLYPAAPPARVPFSYYR
jgi:hypothetical protein